MSSLGVAVVGLGVGEQHARAFAALEGCRLRWLLDLDPARAERLVAALGQGAVAERLEQVLADPEVSIVSIASFDDAHYAQVLAALGAGKHVFVEKPLCRFEHELRDIRAAWLAAGQPALASNLVLRAAPLYRWLRAAIAAGELGEVYAFDGDYLYGRLEKITSGWRKDVPDYSVLEGGGVHLLDLLLWCTGQRPQRVRCWGSKLATRDTAFRYDDYRAATYTFASGLIARITANFGCVHRHQHVVRVFGTRATLIHDDAGPRIHRRRADGAPAEPLELASLPASKGALIPEFVGGILREDTAPDDALLCFDVVSALAAADLSARTGTEVEIEYLR